MTPTERHNLLTKDQDFLDRKGIAREKIEHQLRHLRSGSHSVKLLAACTTGNGLQVLPQGEFELYRRTFREARLAGRVEKFVPASGAATRMFRSLNSAMLGEDDPAPLDEFCRNLLKFPFAGILREQLAENGRDLDQLLAAGAFAEIVAFVLTGEGLGYNQFPKGLLPFHQYANGEVRTAFEEHLVEAAAYTRDVEGLARVHFTVAPQHRRIIEAHIAEAVRKLSEPGLKYRIGYSSQNPATDAVSLDSEENPVRDEAGNLHLRPAGHGALLENIVGLAGDIVFIKNIDNVVPDSLREPTITHKILLGGYLLTLQKKVFAYLAALDRGEPDEALIEEMAAFCAETLSRPLDRAFPEKSRDAQSDLLRAVLNRPLRVCGMVPNAGEPGGGPFWIEDRRGMRSIQIVESAQVDHLDPRQETIWNASTHFNPVDLVCGVRDYRGEPFDLDAFADPEACFVTSKSMQGKKVTVFELPGLWNGAMAGWNTVFVEVPAETFNPVKTVFDLLREGHKA